MSANQMIRIVAETFGAEKALSVVAEGKRKYGWREDRVVEYNEAVADATKEVSSPATHTEVTPLEPAAYNTSFAPVEKKSKKKEKYDE